MTIDGRGETMKVDTWLAELKIPREAYRVVMLLPLVYVAWADGKIQSQERKLIMRIAEERGLLDHGGLLGLRSARHEAEHAALKTIAAAVDVRNAKHWHAFVSQPSGA
jgi:tellurite resistance protein